MQFRLDDPVLDRLLVTGSDPALGPEAINGFFGLLETVNAARDVDDLRALASIDARDGADGAITLLVDGDLRLNAVLEEGVNGPILRVDSMTRGGSGHG